MYRVCALILCIGLAVSGCASKEQSAMGNVVHAGGFDQQSPVYQGDISRKYRVLKEIHIRRTQIYGSGYYDHISGVAWLSAAGREIGADAVIKASTRRIESANILVHPGYFEAHGVAVKFIK